MALIDEVEAALTAGLRAITSSYQETTGNPDVQHLDQIETLSTSLAIMAGVRAQILANGTMASTIIFEADDDEYDSSDPDELRS